MSMTCNVSLGAYGRVTLMEAVKAALTTAPKDPVLGPLSVRHLQLCPQSRGKIDEDVAAMLRREFPDVSWRLHANVQLDDRQRVVDLVDMSREREWFSRVRRVSEALGAEVYSAHAGRRRGSHSMKALIVETLQLEDRLGMPVAIEGHYPTPDHDWLVDCWAEYRWLFDSGCRYVIDLSHINILAAQSGLYNLEMLKEALASPNCLEVHLSHNNGIRDDHLPLEDEPWWLHLLSYTNPNATLFYEGRLKLET